MDGPRARARACARAREPLGRLSLSLPMTRRETVDGATLILGGPEAREHCDRKNKVYIHHMSFLTSSRVTCTISLSSFLSRKAQMIVEAQCGLWSEIWRVACAGGQGNSATCCRDTSSQRGKIQRNIGRISTDRPVYLSCRPRAAAAAAVASFCRCKADRGDKWPRPPPPPR